MSAREPRDWTVLVLGESGQPARRYRIKRSVLAMLVLAIPLLGVGLGYVLSRSSAAHNAAASIASSERGRTAPTMTPAIASRPPPPPTPPVTAAAAARAPLLLVRDESTQEPIEVDPFEADGSPRASAFQLLETEMACGSGHHQTPDPALVHVLLEAQHNFGKPLVLLGGRCPRHEDHPETVEYHRAGRAADVRVREVTSEQLMSWLVERGVGGVGRYKQRGGFVHVDVRVGPSEQWEGKPDAPKPAAKREPATAAPSDAVTPEPPAATQPAAEPAAMPATEN